MAQKTAEMRLAALVEAGMVLASELDLDSLLQRIADLSREVIGARYGAVGVLNDEGELVRFVHSGVDEETVRKIGPLPTGKGLLGLIIEEGRPVRLRDISDHPRSAGFPEHHPKMRSFLGAPIIGRDRVSGRLYLSEKLDGTEFSKDDERIAMMFAAQAGIALENARLYDEVRARGDELARRVEELSSLEHVGDLLISEASVHEVLQSLAEETCKLTRAQRATVVILDEQTGEMVIRRAAGDRLADDLVGRRLAPGKSKAEAVMKRGSAELAPDLLADPEIERATIQRLGDPRAGAFAPLLVRGRGIGALAAYDPKGRDAFSIDDLAILQILANQAAVAVENDRLSEALKDLAVLEERERISKELHDGVIQSIYSVGLSLQGSLSLLRRDPQRATGRIDEAIAELDNVVRDVRSYIFELQPKLVKDAGLGRAITELARDLEVNTLAHVTLDLDEVACSALDGRQQSDVVQVVREILSNIARHAEASQVQLVCFRSQGNIHLQVEDNGIGFDPSRVLRGHGLTNMTQRIERLGGQIDIAPRETEGTRHSLVIPIDGSEGGSD